MHCISNPLLSLLLSNQHHPAAGAGAANSKPPTSLPAAHTSRSTHKKLGQWDDAINTPSMDDNSLAVPAAPSHMHVLLQPVPHSDVTAQAAGTQQLLTASATSTAGISTMNQQMSIAYDA
jgi:hypothetical protein